MNNIDIGNGYSLSVDTDITNGVSVTLAKDGEFVQDLVVVEKVGGENAVRAFVWSNEKDEDFTHRLTIPFRKDSNRDTDGGSHRESRQTW